MSEMMFQRWKLHFNLPNSFATRVLSLRGNLHTRKNMDILQIIQSAEQHYCSFLYCFRLFLKNIYRISESTDVHEHWLVNKYVFKCTLYISDFDTFIATPPVFVPSVLFPRFKENLIKLINFVYLNLNYHMLPCQA